MANCAVCVAITLYNALLGLHANSFRHNNDLKRRTDADTPKLKPYKSAFVLFISFRRDQRLILISPKTESSHNDYFKHKSNHLMHHI